MLRTMNDLRLLLQQTIERWRGENIPIPLGVDDAKLSEFESHYRVKLPDDMREYFATMNGMGDHYDEEFFFRFWPLERVQLVGEHCPEVTKAFPESNGYFLFFDHSIEVFMYAIQLNGTRNTPTPIAMIYPQTPWASPSFDNFCESFTDFLDLYVTNPAKLF
jgi:SMI1 / KNR4 family (SUKH-1)